VALLFILFMVIGLVMSLAPTFFWMLTEQWKSRDATEPSTLFILSTRFGGGMFAILGLLGVIFVR
jgi:hypothetical protein